MTLVSMSSAAAIAEAEADADADPLNVYVDVYQNVGDTYQGSPDVAPEEEEDSEVAIPTPDPVPDDGSFEINGQTFKYIPGNPVLNVDEAFELCEKEELGMAEPDDNSAKEVRDYLFNEYGAVHTYVGVVTEYESESEELEFYWLSSAMNDGTDGPADKYNIPVGDGSEPVDCVSMHADHRVMEEFPFMVDQVYVTAPCVPLPSTHEYPIHNVTGVLCQKMMF